MNANTVIRRYTWGLDLSGRRAAGFSPARFPDTGGRDEFHNAGGIGGLLSVVDTPADLSGWYFYDANGNVGQIVQDTAGSPVVARYEYDPYGNSLAQPEGYAASNPWRFSITCMR